MGLLNLFKALLVVLLPMGLYSVESRPADICFFVTDMKYSRERGIKICEVQHGILSMFKGTSFLVPGDVSIQQRFLGVLSQYSPKGWTILTHIDDPGLRWVLSTAYNWRVKNSLQEIFQDHEFLAHAKQPVHDKSDLSAYHGFLFASASLLKKDEELEERCPGIIVIDKSSFPFWVDKYKMTVLFDRDPILSAMKPKWGLYKKEYSKDLASKIISDLKCNAFVIKPRGAFLGNGVILVEKDQLDSVLEYIINSSQSAKDHPDPAFNYWSKDRFNSFIVEEFATSDLVMAPHLGTKIYQPTMRVAFVLVHTKGAFNVHFLGAYWKTPTFSVFEEASFMQKNKDICEPPFYLAVDPETWADVKNKLQIALPILHKEMLLARQANR